MNAATYYLVNRILTSMRNLTHIGRERHIDITLEQAIQQSTFASSSMLIRRNCSSCIIFFWNFTSSVSKSDLVASSVSVLSSISDIVAFNTDCRESVSYCLYRGLHILVINAHGMQYLHFLQISSTSQILSVKFLNRATLRLVETLRKLHYIVQK